MSSSPGASALTDPGGKLESQEFIPALQGDTTAVVRPTLAVCCPKERNLGTIGFYRTGNKPKRGKGMGNGRRVSSGSIVDTENDRQDLNEHLYTWLLSV